MFLRYIQVLAGIIQYTYSNPAFSLNEIDLETLFLASIYSFEGLIIFIAFTYELISIAAASFYRSEWFEHWLEGS